MTSRSAPAAGVSHPASPDRTSSPENPVVDERRFRAARRHSRWVRSFKVILPVIAVALAAGFAGWSWLASPGSFSVDISGTALRDGKLVMSNPKLDGFTGNDLPYTMTALRAIQDVGGGGPVALEEITARVPISDTVMADITAPSGLYYNDANRLDITSDLTVETSDGMVALLKSASIDLSDGSLTTDDDVDIKSHGATIRSESMSAQDGGKVLVFERRVRVDIKPERLKTADATSRSSDAPN